MMLSTFTSSLSMCGSAPFQAHKVGLQRRRVAARCTAQLVLVPTGNGSTDHLDSRVSMPGEITLKEGLYELGREEPADVIVPVPTVSTRHAMLRVEPGNKVTVTDLDSTNGTYVDDREVKALKSAKLNVGSEVVFGDMFLAKFQLQDRSDAPVSQRVSTTSADAKVGDEAGVADVE